MQGGSRQRSSARISLQQTVEYTPYGVLLPRLEKVTLRGTIVNVSADDRGLGFVTCHPLFTGRKMRLVTGGVARTAEVRWVATAPSGYRVGVRFRRVQPSAARG